MNIDLKKCPKCLFHKRLDGFSKSRKWLASWCKPCTSAISMRLAKFRYANDAVYKRHVLDYNNKRLTILYQTNPEFRNIRLASCNAYKKLHTAKHCALSSKRRAQKLLATPQWLTKQDYIDIEQFYIDAKEHAWLSEEPLHVDHIVPLVSKVVCGLHVPWNLQILLQSINCKKNNKLGV